MVDTVSIHLTHRVQLALDDPSWIVGTHDERMGAGENAIQTKQMSYARCAQTGMRLWGSNAGFERVQFSLPHLLFGRNDVLVDSPEVLSAAVSESKRQFSARLNSPLSGAVTRIDLCHQFSGRAEEFVNALRDAKHPRMRKRNRDIDGQTLYIRGAELEFCVYDKGAEKGLRPHKMVRAEWRLKRGRSVAREFGKCLQFDELEFHECRRVFRSLTEGLTPRKLPAFSTRWTIPRVFAYLETVGEGPRVQDILSQMPRYTRRRTINQLRAARLQTHTFDMGALYGPTLVETNT